MNVRKHVLAEERDRVSFSKYNSHHWESWENVNDGKCSVPYSSCSEPSDCLWSKPLLHKRASHRGNKSKQVEIFNTGLQGQHDLSRVCKLKDGRKKKHFTLLNFKKKKHTFNTKLQGTVQYNHSAKSPNPWAIFICVPCKPFMGLPTHSPHSFPWQVASSSHVGPQRVTLCAQVKLKHAGAWRTGHSHSCRQ